MSKSTDPAPKSRNFIQDIIDNDLKTGRVKAVVTRFPPEPNGYLHIGHAKSICLNFGLANEYSEYKGSRCHLRFDDTNPVKEDTEYVEAIQRDIRWLGFDWHDNLYFASDYFEQLYQFAVQLIEKGRAYVCSLTEEEVRAQRGSITKPGTLSPYRNRSVEENRELFGAMRAGKFEDGAHTLRAKIDMAHPNMKLRDPPLYRIRKAHHHRTGNAWCIYPLYDFTHGLSDALEHITHSICTLEFENNRPLYDWFIESCAPPSTPHQYEFARLSLTYIITSKRKLLSLVQEGHVNGWDDPRMPTLAGLKRRGVTPEAIRNFCTMVGVAKSNSLVDIAQFEFCIRDDLNHRAPRVLAVLDPLKVVITDYSEDKTETLTAAYWPHDIPKEDSRDLLFSRELYIERSDFEETPQKGFYRLAPGREVRLRYGYVIRCTEVIKNTAGDIVEVHCTHDPKTRGGASPKDRKIKGTIHWVSAQHAINAELRLYDRLFRVEVPEGDESELNPESLKTVMAKVEPSLLQVCPGERFQFERQGYFMVDDDSTEGSLIFNRTIALRDSWAKEAEKPEKKETKKPETTTKTLNAASKTKSVAKKPEASDKAKAWGAEYGIALDDAVIIDASMQLTGSFEQGVDEVHTPRALAHWLVNEVQSALKTPEHSAHKIHGLKHATLLNLVHDNTISTKAAKQVFAIMCTAPEQDPGEIVKAEGLAQLSDEAAIEAVIDQVLSAYPDSISKYQAGKTNILGFLVGKVMQHTQGRANPKLVNTALLKRLKEN